MVMSGARQWATRAVKCPSLALENTFERRLAEAMENRVNRRDYCFVPWCHQTLF